MDNTLASIAAEFDEEFHPIEDKSKTVQSVPSTSTPATTSTSAVTGNTNCLLVNPKQRGNPLLKSVSEVPWQYSDIVADYQMGPSVCALFLSLRYHNLNPDYIHDRLKLLGNKFELRVLLVQVDTKDPHHALKSLTRICILANLTLILAWNADEAGRILETYKVYQNKPADKIMEKSENTPYLKLIQALTSIKPVNKTDAMILISKFETLEGILNASELQLSNCPGFGERKARKLYQVLHENFKKK